MQHPDTMGKKILAIAMVAVFLLSISLGVVPYLE